MVLRNGSLCLFQPRLSCRILYQGGWPPTAGSNVGDCRRMRLKAALLFALLGTQLGSAQQPLVSPEETNERIRRLATAYQARAGDYVIGSGDLLRIDPVPVAGRGAECGGFYFAVLLLLQVLSLCLRRGKGCPMVEAARAGFRGGWHGVAPRRLFPSPCSPRLHAPLFGFPDTSRPFPADNLLGVAI